MGLFLRYKYSTLQQTDNNFFKRLFLVGIRKPTPQNKLQARKCRKVDRDGRSGRVRYSSTSVKKHEIKKNREIKVFSFVAPVTYTLRCRPELTDKNHYRQSVKFLPHHTALITLSGNNTVAERPSFICYK